MTTPIARHGTISGHKKHLLNGERPCDPCYRAKAAYDKRRRQIPHQLHMSRLRARAQSHAESALTRKYHEEYRRLYDAALAALVEDDG